MRPRPRRLWWIFAVAAIALTAVLAWVSHALVVLDRQRAEARLESSRRAVIGEALWRMDSWLAPQLAYEAARPEYEYQPYFGQETTYTKVLNPIQAGEVLSPSPLLSFESDIFVLHWQRDEDGTLSSPQVPTGNFRDLAEATLENGARIAEAEQRLTHLQRLLGQRRPDLAAAYARETERLEIQAPEHAEGPLQNFNDRAQSMQLAKQSAAGNRQLRGTAPGRTERWILDPFVPIWLGAEGGDDLVFVRRIRNSGTSRHQGVLVSWPALRSALLARAGSDGDWQLGLEVDDRQAGDAPNGAGAAPERDWTWLATLPAHVTASATLAVTGRLSRETGVALALAWAALVLALTSVGFAVRSTVRQSERRARFASTVTHELRTPLTTFCLYTEMLAEGMIQGAAQQHEYLRTLESESQRLSRLVENVLSYARIEEGRFTARPQRLGVTVLLERVAPHLHRRAADAGMRLDIRSEIDAELFVDVEAVLQILFNLVDNACKYGGSEEDPRIDLVASGQGRHVQFVVRDRGRGVPFELRHAVFRPFERRALRDEDLRRPGIGLGLALARALARDLGGDLRLARPSGTGASFVLELPRA